MFTKKSRHYYKCSEGFRFFLLAAERRLDKGKILG